jgi:LPXTG-motif cell wall-anchored protein
MTTQPLSHFARGCALSLALCVAAPVFAQGVDNDGRTTPSTMSDTSERNYSWLGLLGLAGLIGLMRKRRDDTVVRR